MLIRARSSEQNMLVMSVAPSRLLEEQILLLSEILHTRFHDG